MPNASLAEWLIARFTDGSRAATVVGDILEDEPERGPLWFWLSIAGIVLSFTWRRLLAFMAAYLCVSLLRVLWVTAYAPLHGMPAAHRLPGNWVPLFAVVVMIGGLLSTAASYAAIRYGFRDEFTFR